LIIDYNREVKKNNDKIDIGSFLLSFLKFYGFDFDYEHLGFSVNNNNFGCTFFKDERPEMNCSNTICAENIQEQGVDIGKSCYNYKRIVCLFKATYDQIRNEKQKKITRKRITQFSSKITRKYINNKSNDNNLKK